MDRRTAEGCAAFLIPRLRPGMRLLDCGCHTGSITLGLASRVAPAEVVGVDVGAERLERARQQAASQGITNVRFQTANTNDLPFPDASFDAVYMHHVLEYIGEPMRTLREMHRVLRPGGVMGVRELDMDGFVVAPPNAAVSELYGLFDRLTRMSGGFGSRAGKHLRGWFNEVGCVRVKASASYDSSGDPESLLASAESLCSRLHGESFLRSQGLLEPGQAEEMAAAIRDWAQSPGCPGRKCSSV